VRKPLIRTLIRKVSHHKGRERENEKDWMLGVAQPEMNVVFGRIPYCFLWWRLYFAWELAFKVEGAGAEDGVSGMGKIPAWRASEIGMRRMRDEG
jgi:hypothetical protein